MSQSKASQSQSVSGVPNENPTQNKTTPESTERRSFLTGLNAGAVALAGIAAGGVALGQSSAAASDWTPGRHAKDDWMDVAGVQHRFVMDTTSPAGFSDALLYSGNFLTANRNDYGLEDKDSSVIVVARHGSTQMGFNDAMWAKYGEALSGGGVDPRTKEVPTANPYAAQMNRLAGQGVQFAVCSMATRRLAGMAARASGGDTDAVFAELTSNLMTNGKMVPAGIVAVNRAQERGYAMVNV